MNIEHLEERVNDYRASIKTVIEKKNIWHKTTKKLLKKTLTEIVKKYNIGWCVQELNWMNTNDSININFESFPDEFIEQTSLTPSLQFIKGGALIFTQTYSGDVNVFTLYPYIENSPDNLSDNEIEVYNPQMIDERLIIEKVDEFLKDMINWEVPNVKNKVGF